VSAEVMMVEEEDVGGGVDWDYNATTTLLHTNQS
jgi:hypothetical protein